MRILHLDAGREMRGGQWQVLRLIEGLASEGVESTLLARPGCPLFTMAREAGLRVASFGITHLLVLAGRHDLIHAHDARSHTFGLLAPATPLVVSRRVAFPVHSRWKYSRVRHYLAVSEHVQSVLVAGGIAAEKIAVVPDGVPLMERARGTEILAPANADDPEKGAPLAMEAARAAGVTLRLSGDLARDLREAAVFVYITHSEGLGSAALLAMSAGVPVVASRVGGLTEVITHGENGLLVDNSTEAIAAAIRQLLDQPELAARLSQAARYTIQEKFTTDLMVRRTMDVYRQMLS